MRLVQHSGASGWLASAFGIWGQWHLSRLWVAEDMQAPDAIYAALEEMGNGDVELSQILHEGHTRDIFLARRQIGVCSHAL